MRRRNAVTPGAEWGPGQIMDGGSLGAMECLEAIKPAYDEAVAAGKAVGLGLGLKNSGLGNGFKEISRAVVHFVPDAAHPAGSPAGPDTVVEVRHCWTEMGPGRPHRGPAGGRRGARGASRAGAGLRRHQPRAGARARPPARGAR